MEASTGTDESADATVAGATEDQPFWVTPTMTHGETVGRANE